MMSNRTSLLGLTLVILSVGCGGAAAFPTTPPPPAPVATADFPPFREMVLENGLRLVVVERATQPVVAIALALPAGSVHDPRGKEGVAAIMASVLTKGAGGRSAEEIAAAIEGVGGSLNAVASQDNVLVLSNILTPNVPLAMELMGEVVTRPDFAREEVELARGQALQGLQFQLSSPGSLAARVFATRLYGDHPYGRVTTARSLGELAREDLVAFHAQRVRPAGATLVLAGDITLERAGSLAREAFGDWHGSAPETPGRPAPPPRSSPEILLVDRPGSTQASFVVGNLTTRPGTQGRYAATVANEVLGSVPQGRLFQVLRERHGWTYKSSSSLQQPLDLGSFRAVAAVRNEVADSALTELLAQLRRVGDEPIPADELEGARNSLVGRFPLQIETAQQVAGQVLQAILAGLPEDHLRTYRTRLAAVHADEARAAAAEWIRPDEALIVVVGDASEIEHKLATVASVTIVDAEGRPIDQAAPTAATYHLTPSALAPRRDSMTILVQGAPMGWQRGTLERTTDGWRYVEEAEIGAMVRQRTELLLTAEGLPRSLVQTGSAGGQPVDVRLLYEGGRVTGTAQVPGQPERQIAVDIPANALDDNALTALIPALPWASDAAFSIPQFSGGKGTLDIVTLEVVGTEQVTVPAGTFQAYRVELRGGPQPATLFVSTTAPHRLVQITPQGPPIEIVRAN